MACFLFVGSHHRSRACEGKQSDSRKPLWNQLGSDAVLLHQRAEDPAPLA
jgi:hypothetical protein